MLVVQKKASIILENNIHVNGDCNDHYFSDCIGLEKNVNLEK